MFTDLRSHGSGLPFAVLTYLSSAVGNTGRLVLLTVSEGQSSAVVATRGALGPSRMFLHVCGVYLV